MLWAGRDYTRAGAYLQQALEIARGLDDASALAQSLNRVGNWHGTLERPLESAELHRQALSLFESSGDEAGIASTLDLLGMANLIRGDYHTSTDYYRRAIAYFERLNDQAGLASSLATLPIRGGCYHGDCSPPVDALDVAALEGYRAIEIARRIGWRSGESFALWDLAKAVGPAGHYREALALAQQSLDIVNDIDHLQWRTATEFVFGSIYLDLLAVTPALERLERAHQLAAESGSLFWQKHTAAGLARALIAAGDLGLACGEAGGQAAGAGSAIRR
jgi:tetratricopeptide (TPR) repeat protein